MARAKPTKPIPPFPPNLDRRDFANWLSGFVDGEGCFFLHLMRRNQRLADAAAVFHIALRADDEIILHRIRSFWQCGTIHKQKPRLGNPARLYAVRDFKDCHNVLVPHFEKYPLQAKKRLDFVIWKEAVELTYHVRSRWHHCLGIRGRLPSWKADELARFVSLKNALKDQRAFRFPTVQLPHN